MTDPIWYIDRVRDHRYALVNNTGAAALAVEVRAHGITLIGANRNVVHRIDRLDVGDRIEFNMRTELMGAEHTDQGVAVEWSDENSPARHHATCLVKRVII